MPHLSFFSAAGRSVARGRSVCRPFSSPPSRSRRLSRYTRTAWWNNCRPPHRRRTSHGMLGVGCVQPLPLLLMLVALRAPSTPPRSCVAAVERIPRHRDEARAHAPPARYPRGRRRRRRRCHDGPLIATTLEDPAVAAVSAAVSGLIAIGWRPHSLLLQLPPPHLALAQGAHREVRRERALHLWRDRRAQRRWRATKGGLGATLPRSRPRVRPRLWRQRAMQEVVPAEQRCDVLEHICGDRAALTARGAPRRRRECVTICHCHRGGGCIGGKGVGGWRRLEEELRWRLMSPDHRRRHAEARLVAQRAKRRRQRRGARAPRPSVGVAHPDRVRWRSSSRGCVPPQERLQYDK